MKLNDGGGGKLSSEVDFHQSASGARLLWLAI